jgi:hypothetical protein
MQFLIWGEIVGRELPFEGKIGTDLVSTPSLFPCLTGSYFKSLNPFKITKIVLPSCPITPKGRSIT